MCNGRDVNIAQKALVNEIKSINPSLTCTAIYDPMRMLVNCIYIEELGMEFDISLNGVISYYIKDGSKIYANSVDYKDGFEFFLVGYVYNKIRDYDPKPTKFVNDDSYHRVCQTRKKVAGLIKRQKEMLHDLQLCGLDESVSKQQSLLSSTRKFAVGLEIFYTVFVRNRPWEGSVTDRDLNMICSFVDYNDHFWVASDKTLSWMGAKFPNSQRIKDELERKGLKPCHHLYAKQREDGEIRILEG